MNFALYRILVISGILSVAILSSFAVAQKGEVKVGDVYPGDVSIGGFELSSEETVFIEGRAVSFKDFDENLIYHGWILNSSTRDVVWHLEDADDYEDDGGMYEFQDEIRLPAGKYEVYFSGNIFDYSDIRSVSDFFGRVFKSKNSSFKRRDRSKLGMTIKADDSFRVIDGESAADEFVEDAIVSMIRVGDSEELSRGFSLSDETNIRIIALGEGRDRSIYDFAWIYDLKKNKIVWKMNPRRSERAGGGRKNLVVNKELTLPRGSYKVHYVTDDSHSYDEWNVLPPNDPQMWGVSIWPASDEDARNVIPFEEVREAEPIVKINKVRDSEFISQGFTLKERLEIRVLCLGEGYEKHDLSDYGWIVNADTREVVWDMQRNRRMEHAGGSDKNRMVDEVIRLDAGNYIVYYTTDDSHSYKDWNAEAPFERSRWGITLWVEDEDKRSSVKTFSEGEYNNENVLAEIVRVRDGREYNRSFILDSDSRVRIIAIGEGTRSGMVDYGWIENENGRVVWEMTYRKTEHAGGAKKNREFNDTIMLEAGKYHVYYETDDSHSFKDWNSSPPRNQESYGITIIRE